MQYLNLYGKILVNNRLDLPGASILKIAVLILTYNRVHLLKKCIDSIINQNKHPYDLHFYISVNGPDIAARDYLESVKSQISLTYIYSDYEIPVGEARNKLINMIDEKWICFLDDDIYLPSNYFQKADEVQKKFPEIDIFGGPDQNTDEANDFQNALSLVMENYLATGPTNKRHKSVGEEIVDGNEVNLILCNFWAKKSVFNLKMFPVKFRRNEENYLMAILHDKGIKMKYVPFMKVHHNRKVDYYKIIRVLYLAGIYRSISLIYYPKSARLIFFLHILFLTSIGLSFIINKSLGITYLLLYVIIIAIQSFLISIKLKKAKSFFFGMSLFIIFNFVYPVGQIHGYLKGLNFKLNGVQF